MAEKKKKQEIQADAELVAEVTEVVTDTNIDLEAPNLTIKDQTVAGASSKNTQDSTLADADNVKTSEDDGETKFTKAGRRSKKSVGEAESEADRKATAKTDDDDPKKAVIKFNPPVKHGRKFRDAAKLVDRTKHYDLAEGLVLAKKTSTVKFDAAVELHINLGVDPRQADQMVRASVVLPAGTGRSIRVAVLAPADKQAAAKTAGADLVGDDDLIAKIDKGEFGFDMLVATPDMMPKLGKLARVLGPKGLMPNPKSGTVTSDVAKAVTEAKAGKVEFRIDKQGILHQAVGKVSFSDDKLMQNIVAFVDAVMKSKPASAKGTYVKAVTLTTSMGPGVKLNTTEVIATVQAKR